MSDSKLQRKSERRRLKILEKSKDRMSKIMGDNKS